VKHFILIFSLVLSTQVVADDLVVTERHTFQSSKEVPLEQPLLVFELLDVPSSGNVSGLSGEIYLYTAYGWEPLREKQELGAGSKLHITADSSLTIQFSENESAIFNPAPADRWVEFHVK
jgi:hypothetical protein